VSTTVTQVTCSGASTTVTQVTCSDASRLQWHKSPTMMQVTCSDAKCFLVQSGQLLCQKYFHWNLLPLRILFFIWKLSNSLSLKRNGVLKFLKLLQVTTRRQLFRDFTNLGSIHKSYQCVFNFFIQISRFKCCTNSCWCFLVNLCLLIFFYVQWCRNMHLVN
jgi:hypothetical protein